MNHDIKLFYGKGLDFKGELHYMNYFIDNVSMFRYYPINDKCIFSIKNKLIVFEILQIIEDECVLNACGCHLSVPKNEKIQEFIKSCELSDVQYDAFNIERPFKLKFID
jgi:hypothetical protein